MHITTMTTNYQLVLADANGAVLQLHGGGGDLNLTVPPNSVVAFPIGTEVQVTNFDADGGATNFVAGSGVTLIDMGEALYLGQARTSLLQIATNKWLAKRY